MITFYIHRTVHGRVHPWLRTAFHWFPRDKKDRKDSRNSGRLNTCNLPPSELTSHTLLWRVMEWTNSGIMSGSIESNLRRNAHSHAQMPCGGIMGSITTWTVPRRRKGSKISGPAWTRCRSRTAMRWLERLGACVPSTSGSPLPPDWNWWHSWCWNWWVMIIEITQLVMHYIYYI